jgi:hypothetical protein
MYNEVRALECNPSLARRDAAGRRLWERHPGPNPDSARQVMRDRIRSERENLEGTLMSEPRGAKGLRRKSGFGGAGVDHFAPTITVAMPKVLHCVVTFEEALKLHLSLGQLLGHLNGYDRSRRSERRTAVDLCVHTKNGRIFLVQGRTRE